MQHRKEDSSVALLFEFTLVPKCIKSLFTITIKEYIKLGPAVKDSVNFQMFSRHQKCLN